MKRIFLLTALFTSAFITLLAQQPPAIDPNTPTLTLEQKIILITDDLKLQDALEKAQKVYAESIKSTQDHQKAAKEAIEKDHPGWTLANGPQGWYFTKIKAPETPKK